MKPAKKQTVFATHVTLQDGSRVYVKGTSAEDRDRKVSEVKARQGLGLNSKAFTTFREYGELWLRTYKPKTALRPTSYQALLNTFENHVVPFFSDMPLDKIQPMHIRLFLTHIAQTSKSQQQKSWGMVKSIFATAVDNHLLTESPIKSSDKLLPSAAEEPEEPLTDDQVRALLSATEGTRIHLFLQLALGTGLRRGEILGLMWEDVDLDQGIIQVRHNKAIPAKQNDAPVTEMLKTDAGRRRIPVPSKLLDVLRELHRDDDSLYVFHATDGDSYTRSSFRSAWKVLERRTVGKGDVQRELGARFGGVCVTLDFTTHPHQLRHTYITKLFEQGLDIKQVQYLAGHATPEITMRIYTHYRQKQREASTTEQVRCAVDYL